MPVAFAVASLVVAAAGTTASIVSGNQSRAAQRHATDLQEQSQNEQRAGNAAQAANERRNQFREERIRRARIEQSAQNTGTADSSGELGSLAALSTNTNSAMGFNLGALQRADNISIFNQQAADTLAEGRQNAATTQNIGSIFQGIGQGISSYSAATAKVPTTTT